MVRLTLFTTLTTRLALFRAGGFRTSRQFISQFQRSIGPNTDHYSLAARDRARAGDPANRPGAGRWRSLAIDKPFSDRRGASGDGARADGDPLRLRPLNSNGQSATLMWSSTNATTCSGTGFSASGTSGSLTVSPTATTTYGITCTGSGGSASQSVTVAVTPAPKLAVGMTVQTAGSVAMHASPSMSAPLVGALAPGSKGTIIGGPASADGSTWWEMSSKTGLRHGLFKTSSCKPARRPAKRMRRAVRQRLRLA